MIFRLLLALAVLVLALPGVAAASTASAEYGWLGWAGALLAGLALANLLGTGIVPTGALGSQLEAVTRRAFIPSLVVQINNATPMLGAGLSNAQMASGGVSSVTAPVQGAALTTAQYTDYSGAFDPPSNAQGIYEGSWNLKALVVPIGFLGMEGLVQMNAAVIPIIEARMNDSGNQAAVTLAGDMATNDSDTENSIAGFVAAAATTGTYGNISKDSNTWWQGKAIAAGAVDPTRARVLQYIVQATSHNLGEMPNIGVMAPGTWLKLAQDFVSAESFRITPGDNFAQTTQGPGSSFTALQVAGVPIYMDMNFTEGELILFNTRYTSFYIHEAAAFAFTGFASTIPSFTLGYVGVLVAVLEFLSVKPRSVCRVTGLNSVSV
jgi:hypothetical protein